MYVCVCVSLPDTGNSFLLGTPFSCVAFKIMSCVSVKPPKNLPLQIHSKKSFRMQHPAPSVTLATGGYDRQIRFWSPQDGSCRHHIMFPDSVRLSLYICQSCLSFRSDATIVLRKYRTTLSHIFSLFSFRRDDGFTKYRTTLSLIFFSVFIPTRRSFYKKYRTNSKSIDSR